MSKVIFNTIEELVADIKEGDDRAAFCVKYRAKDSFALATSETEAMGEVARAMGMEVGLIPLDMIVAATRRMMSGATPTPAANAGAPANAIPPETLAAVTTEKPIAQMKVAEVRAVAEKLGIDTAGKPREQLEKAIFEVRPDFKPASATDFPPQ